MNSREDIYSALFSLIEGVAEFKTTGRRLRHWTDVSPNEQPALFVAQKSEDQKYQTRIPGIWTLHIDIWLYVNTDGDHDSAPSKILNPILDAVMVALQPSPQTDNEQTLGGRVWRCRIDTVETDEGALGDQAIAIVAASIFLPQW